MASDATKFVAGLPFCQKIGVGISEADRMTIPDDATLYNHVGTVHAGAMFTLGESASGAAIADAVTKLGAMPLAKNASIAYRKPAKGALTAVGTVAEDLEIVAGRVKSEGKTTVDVNVSITDATGLEVATMVVTWHLRGG